MVSGNAKHERRATYAYFDAHPEELPKVPWYERLFALFKAWIRKLTSGRRAMFSDADFRKLFRDMLKAVKEDRPYRQGANEFNLENAVASKEGYQVEKVNPRAGAELNLVNGVVLEKTNLVFDPNEVPEKGFKKFVFDRLVEYEIKHPIAGPHYTRALKKKC